MKNFITSVHLHLKSIRFLAFVPFIAVNIIYPLLVYNAYLAFGIDSPLFISAIISNACAVFPFFSVWSVIFVLREYAESDGNELLYAIRHKCKLGLSAAVFAVFMVNGLLWFAGFAYFVYPHLIYDFITVACACFMFFGFTYFLIYLTSSVVLTLMADLFYAFAVIISNFGYSFAFFISGDLLSRKIFIEICLPQLIAGTVFIVSGIVLNKKYVRFK